MQQKAIIYLIPTVLAEDAIESIPTYVLNAIKQCSVFFAENEKTARRYFKVLWKEMVIDNYEWHTIHKAEKEVVTHFTNAIKHGKTIGIISEAGCPCVADPGQILVDTAQKLNAKVVPLVGPNSILMALMASGLNGQAFQFVGYMPIDSLERKNKITALESYSTKQNCTQIFIETPYRNNALLKEVIQTCKSETRLCVAVDITSAKESIVTKTIAEWKQHQPDFHKRQAIFLMLGS
jgi:16S rRNA (cytidine1402-2'-O)-methyltransferase